MISTATNQNESITNRIVPLTPMNLFCERLASVTNNLRAQASGYTFTPFQLGGIQGQQQALNAVATISIINFKVSGQ